MPPKKKVVKSTQPAHQSLRLRGVPSSPNQPTAPDLPVKTNILSKPLPEGANPPPDLPVKTTNLPKQLPEATDPPIDPPFPPLEIEMGNAVGTVECNENKVSKSDCKPRLFPY